MGPEIISFGCRLNAVESEAIRASTAGQDDLVVFNTCAVTAEASRQARQAIRRVRRERPEARIVVTGCAAQVEPDAFAAMPEVDAVVGNAEKTMPETWQRRPGAADFGIGDALRVQVSDIQAVRETAGHLAGGFRERARAFVQVQNGCDHRCTFCIIPFGRGPSRSVPMGAVVRQIRDLVAEGFGEVVLTGVDLTSYGGDLPGTPTLGRLVRAILRQVPELQRLRISSLDAVEVDDDLRAALAGEERLMPHLHLSLQAGDDMILKRMKRRHSRDQAIAFCREMRQLRPGIVFGADLIAGFPTEDEAMFSRSLDIVGECGLTHLHVFPFSPRPGTPAARMPLLPRPLVKERAARLRAAGEAAVAAHLQNEIGQHRHVLVETGEAGRTEHYTPVRLARFAEPGTVAPVVIAGHDGRQLLAA
jgi:threonylcarbamoyladenosine tRNA methylthiotransferase MtaB